MTEQDFIDLETTYRELIIPSNFIKRFETDMEFREWAEEGTLEEIYFIINEFEKEELYEHCQILKEVKDEKILNYLQL